MTQTTVAEPASLVGKHLYLTGYRGSGKTAIGRWLARRLARPWIDSDDSIEAAAQQSIRQIFAEHGEAAFRQLEEEAIAQIAGQQPAVISLGGGAILSERNRQCIARSGRCVWLQVDVETVMRRLAADQGTTARRPALTGLPPQQEIATLLAQREPLYAQVADYQLDTNGQSVEQLGRQVLQQLAAPR